MDRIDSADRGGILSDRYICRTENAGKRFIYGTTLSDGDHLIVDKISYRFREPQRYEIVVFPYRYEKILTILNGSSDFRGNGSDCRRIYLYKRKTA